MIHFRVPVSENDGTISKLRYLQPFSHCSTKLDSNYYRKDVIGHRFLIGQTWKKQPGASPAFYPKITAVFRPRGSGAHRRGSSRSIKVTGRIHCTNVETETSRRSSMNVNSNQGTEFRKATLPSLRRSASGVGSVGLRPFFT